MFLPNIYRALREDRKHPAAQLHQLPKVSRGLHVMGDPWAKKMEKVHEALRCRIHFDPPSSLAEHHVSCPSNRIENMIALWFELTAFNVSKPPHRTHVPLGTIGNPYHLMFRHPCKCRASVHKSRCDQLADRQQDLLVASRGFN